ncbi:MAG TPA: ABC transporter substrate-binding protein [Tepidisphaeraceae bacterium]|jgi:ABC-type dipeptide/oligopeptide/nickel transport system permease component/ABC-type transport system substrate-binding protein
MRIVLRLPLVLFGVICVLWLCGWSLRPDVSDRPPPFTPERSAAAVRSRNPTFDPANTPSLHLKALVKPVGQAPVLTDLEKEGKLPPVAERMPKEPVVMRGDDGIGKYGGTWLRLANGLEDIIVINYRLSGSYLVRWSPLGYPIEPHIAKSVEPSDDARVWTVTLREGMRWSDGAPYTADDIMYWWNAETNNTHLSGIAPQWMSIGGQSGRVEKIDAYHVRFVFPKSYPLFIETLASQLVLTDTPAHYLRRYHPDPAIGDKDLIARDMKAYKMPSPRSLYTYMKQWQNPEHPRLWPWVYRTYKGDPPQVFVRNPYYYVVDAAGNQLPYIDRLQFDVQDGKMLALTAANGGVSMQGRHIRFSDYTELVSRSEIAGTRVLHWYPASRQSWVINPNLNRRVDPADPSSAHKAALLSDKRFRQALSVAIDRQKVIDAEQVGVGTASQVAPGELSPYHNPKLARAFTDYDPKRAAELLDTLGLTRRDNEGYRTFADGSRMTFYLDYTAYTGIGPAQFVVDDWEAVGVRTVMRERSRPLFTIEKDAMNFDFNVWSGESDYMPLLSPRYFIPVNTESFYAVGWARWYMRGGFYGNPKALAGSIPVPTDSPMYQAISLYEKAIQTTDAAKRYELIEQVLDLAAENTWSIGLATAPPNLVVVDKNLRNVPEVALYGVIFSTPANAGIETYFFDQPRSSAGAVAEVKQSIHTPTLRSGGISKDGSGGSWLGTILFGLSLAIPLLLLSMVAVRHPFIGRRLLIMVPTLVLISVVVFALIQLPPGDFLTTRIMMLQENGDPSAEQSIKDMRDLFHFDEPDWKLYLRWTGVRWFFTFDPGDEGLLQGNLGRSMDTQQPINTMVGDRITLTIIVSLATIVFTWAIALPIGIYSAVRQYSLGDYVLTLAGFIGMCVPAFLLALVLIAVSGMSGLFSPEYAAQPEWSWGKFLDLLRHIWIPILVLGVGGTAGMIRVMRANLLDELKKPYVTTALAKGVRPMRLLMKYPVRLALNPFISGIGGLFPQLISGGAIVAMVLALPMVGPLQLQALLTQDTYLAGSMLMVLSLLGVIGTLVSDLLLLWLDPRIRFEGGSR